VGILSAEKNLELRVACLIAQFGQTAKFGQQRPVAPGVDSPAIMRHWWIRIKAERRGICILIGTLPGLLTKAERAKLKGQKTFVSN
jgi:hypothetical protein